MAKCVLCGSPRLPNKRYCERCRKLKYRESKAKSNAKFASSAEGRLWLMEYQHSERRKEGMRIAQRKYEKTLKYKLGAKTRRQREIEKGREILRRAREE